MNSTALYKAFIEAGVSEESATTAAEDVVQVSQLSDLATKSDVAKLEADIEKTELALKADIEKTELVLKTDIVKLEADIKKTEQALKADLEKTEFAWKAEFANLKSDMRDRDNRLIKWMVGCALACVTLAVAGIGILIRVMLSSGVVK